MSALCRRSLALAVSSVAGGASARTAATVAAAVSSAHASRAASTLAWSAGAARGFLSCATGRVASRGCVAEPCAGTAGAVRYSTAVRGRPFGTVTAAALTAPRGATAGGGAAPGRLGSATPSRGISTKRRRIKKMNAHKHKKLAKRMRDLGAKNVRSK